MVKRMDIEYYDREKEGVRQIALRNFKEIYQEFIEDIDNILHAKKTDWREILEVLKEEYEELAK